MKNLKQQSSSKNKIARIGKIFYDPPFQKLLKKEITMSILSIFDLRTCFVACCYPNKRATHQHNADVEKLLPDHLEQQGSQFIVVHNNNLHHFELSIQ